MSDGVAILNPPREASVCLALIDIVTKEVEGLEVELTSKVLERDMYLQKISSIVQLKVIRTRMTKLYGRNFET